jgi:hypothetical protein
MKADGTHGGPSFDPLKDRWDVSALNLTRDDCVRVTCVKCAETNIYGSTLTGMMNLYFHSRWFVLNPNDKLAVAMQAGEIPALCGNCISDYAVMIGQKQEQP